MSNYTIRTGLATSVKINLINTPQVYTLTFHKRIQAQMQYNFKLHTHMQRMSKV